MALSYPARAYAGRASAGTTDVAIGSSFGTGSVFHSQSTAPLTGWTDVTGANWAGTPTPQIVVALGYGTANEEKILCTYNPTGSALTVVTRGYDNTPQGGPTSTWPIGTPFVLVWSATEAAEANAAVRALQPTLAGGYTVLDSHSTASSLTSFGASPTLVTPNLGTPTAINLTNGTNLPATSLTSGALPSGVTLPATQLTSGALPSGVTLPVAQLTSGALPTGVTASKVFQGTTSVTGITGYNNYMIVATAEYSNASGTTGVTQSLTVNGVTGKGTSVAAIVNVSGGQPTLIDLTSVYAYATTAATTFNVSLVASYTSGITVTVSNQNIQIIGFN